MAAPEPSPIACVFGRYALGPEIARGGLATVHLGLARGEAGFARTVAVKRLLPSFARDPEFVASFIDEAKLAARIRHPNVVPTLDVVSQDGELFVVMEYIHGESLAGLIRAAAGRGARIPLAVVSAIVVNTLQGLHAAHDAKDERGAPLHLVHRDVSPQNVLVGADGVARVLDFGIAKAVGRAQVTCEGQVKGKLGYMAPEQLRQSAERATDIYATGVCLWEALAMRRLFSGDNESAVLARIMAGLVEPPSKHAAELPPALDALTLRALHRHPGARFATAREMARALESAVAPASASEVGEWVEGLAASSLARRMERIAEIEAGHDGRDPRPPDPAGSALAPGPWPLAPSPVQPSPERRPELAAPAAALPATPGDASPAASSGVPGSTRIGLEAAPRPSRRRSAWMAWSGLCILLATAALLASALRGARAHAGQDGAAQPSENLADVGSAPIPALQPVRVDTAEPAALPSPGTGSAAPETVPTASSSQLPIPAVARPRARPAAAVAPRANCDPPYSVSADGVRHYKKQCLR